MSGFNTVDYEQIYKLNRCIDDWKSDLEKSRKDQKRQEKTDNKKIPRNSNCPCNSGKKYKKCCGK